MRSPRGDENGGNERASGARATVEADAAADTFCALYVMLPEAVPPRILWNSFEASFGSMSERSCMYGSPIFPEES